MSGRPHRLDAGKLECFYLGTHQPGWLGRVHVPLFVSHRRLADRREFRRAKASWVVDSGGFSELSMYGEWRTEPWPTCNP